MILHTDVNVFGGASSYAFTQMVRPEFGAGIKERLGDGWYVVSRIKTALPNQDPNGGEATTLSLYAGKRWTITRNLDAGLFVGYQHLWYGDLYNNAIGGGFHAGVHAGRWFASMNVADLAGVSGSIGYHLQHPGNDLLFYGRAGYRLTRSLSVYAFLAQQRYVNVGSYGCNSLTYQGTGLGIRYGF